MGICASTGGSDRDAPLLSDTNVVCGKAEDQKKEFASPHLSVALHVRKFHPKTSRRAGLSEFRFSHNGWKTNFSVLFPPSLFVLSNFGFERFVLNCLNFSAIVPKDEPGSVLWSRGQPPLLDFIDPDRVTSLSESKSAVSPSSAGATDSKTSTCATPEIPRPTSNAIPQLPPVSKSWVLRIEILTGHPAFTLASPKQSLDIHGFQIDLYFDRRAFTTSLLTTDDIATLTNLISPLFLKQGRTKGARPSTSLTNLPPSALIPQP
jgi:hypothetical protein